MADVFDDALRDLKDALTSGEDVDLAITATAEDHGVKPEALRNRAKMAWGDLAGYGAKNRAREIEAIALNKEADIIGLARTAMAKPEREWANWTENERQAVHKALRINRFWTRR